MMEEKTMAEWKSTTGEVVTFENQGDSIEGEFISARDGNYFRPNGGKSQVYDLRVAGGAVKTVFGTMILERQMVGIKPGSLIKIVYKGEVPTKTGRMAKSFEVFTK